MKSHLKRHFSLLLAVLLVLTMIPVSTIKVSAKATTVATTAKQTAKKADKKTTKKKTALCCDEDIPLLKTPVFSLGKRNDYTRQAHTLFDELRRIDEDDSVKVVYSRLPKTNGVGMAVYNRLIRAAGFEVINLEQN